MSDVPATDTQITVPSTIYWTPLGVKVRLPEGAYFLFTEFSVNTLLYNVSMTLQEVPTSVIWNLLLASPLRFAHGNSVTSAVSTLTLLLHASASAQATHWR